MASAILLSERPEEDLQIFNRGVGGDRIVNVRPAPPDSFEQVGRSCLRSGAAGHRQSWPQTAGHRQLLNGDSCLWPALRPHGGGRLQPAARADVGPRRRQRHMPRRTAAQRGPSRYGLLCLPCLPCQMLSLAASLMREAVGARRSKIRACVPRLPAGDARGVPGHPVRLHIFYRPLPFQLRKGQAIILPQLQQGQAIIMECHGIHDAQAC